MISYSQSSTAPHKMREFFIRGESFEFFATITDARVEAETPQEALERFIEEYNHPRGLYSASCYSSGFAAIDGSRPLAMWLCNQEIEKIRLTADLRGYGFFSPAPGVIEINGETHTVENPKMGAFVDV